MSAPIHTRLTRLSKRTSSFLLHLSSLLSTSAGIESILCTVIFTLTLVHSQLTRLLTRQYEKLALNFVSKVSLPGETVVAALEPPITNLSQTCKGISALVDTSAEVWMFMRLWGLVHIYKWAHEVYNTQERDPVVNALVWAQIAAAATFQAVENAAYLATKGVLRGPKWESRALRWMAWSNRFWMAQVLLEGARLLRVRSLNWNEDHVAERVEDEQSEEKGSDMSKRKVDSSARKVQSELVRQKWRRDFLANAGWLPLTLHWSYEYESESPVPEVWRGLSGLVPSLVLMREAWRESALM